MQKISYLIILFILVGSFLILGFFPLEIRFFFENETNQLFLRTEPKDSKIILLAVGDIMLSRGVEYQIKKHKDFRWPFLRIANELKKANLVFGNLEGPISDKGTKVGSIYSFRANPPAIEGLVYAGFDILSLANNHIFDYQSIAMKDTMAALEKNNIDYVGAGQNKEQAFFLKIKEIKDTKIGFLAYTNLGPQSWQAGEETPGIAWIQKQNFAEIKKDIEKARKETDVLIVSLHSGEEYISEPVIFQVEFSQMAIDAGADLVIGHHPHIIQKIEKYKDGWIAYSLGNFVFDQGFSEATMKGLLLEVIIEDRKISRVNPREIKISDSFQPYLAKAEEILQGLTLEQKVGQMFIIGFEGVALTSELRDLIKEIHPGGILLLKRNIKNENQLKDLINDLQKAALEDTGLPLFIAVDQEGEPLCRIEWLREKIAQSEIKNAQDARQIGLERGRELKKLGVNLNLAPVLDMSALGDFIFSRTFQKTPDSTGVLAKSIILGQKEAGILTAIKHFPGYGNISFNPETVKIPFLPKIPEISQFQKAMEAEPEMIMTSNAVYEEIDQELAFTLSSKSIQFLKNTLDSDCLLISDDLSSETLKKEFSLPNSIILPMKAGVDILLVAGFVQPKDVKTSFNLLLEEVENKKLSKEKIEHAVLKIIKLKQNL